MILMPATGNHIVDAGAPSPTFAIARRALRRSGRHRIQYPVVLALTVHSGARCLSGEDGCVVDIRISTSEVALCCIRDQQRDLLRRLRLGDRAVASERRRRIALAPFSPRLLGSEPHLGALVPPTARCPQRCSSCSGLAVHSRPLNRDKPSARGRSGGIDRDGLRRALRRGGGASGGPREGRPRGALAGPVLQPRQSVGANPCCRSSASSSVSITPTS